MSKRPTLYAVPTGSRYHRDPQCIGLNSYNMASAGNPLLPTVTLREAGRRGLTPCTMCKPPPTLGVIEGGAA